MVWVCKKLVKLAVDSGVKKIDTRIFTRSLAYSTILKLTTQQKLHQRC